jgi:predicted nuclease with TOPRIM domain
MKMVSNISTKLTCAKDECCFDKPKSYSQVLKDYQDVLFKHLEMIKENEHANTTIESLRSLNARLMEKVKEKEEECIRLEKQTQMFVRTYTNMSIEMLKMEEKIAKYEGRVF